MMASILSEFAIRHRPPQHPLDPLKPHGQVVKPSVSLLESIPQLRLRAIEPSPNAPEGAPHFLKTSPKLPFKRHPLLGHHPLLSLELLNPPGEFVVVRAQRFQ